MGSMSIPEMIMRSLLSFVTLLIMARIMGKQQLSHLSFFDYITGITIGSIAAVVCLDPELPIVDGVIEIALWGLLATALGQLSLRNIKARKLLDGEATVVIERGKILEKNMARMHYNMHELLSQLRNQQVFDPGEVEFALLEPNGQLSVLKKPDYQAATRKDLGITTPPKEQVRLPMEVIVDGVVLKDSLIRNGLNEDWLKKQLEKQGVKDIRQVVLAMLKEDGQLYIDEKKD